MKREHRQNFYKLAMALWAGNLPGRFDMADFKTKGAANLSPASRSCGTAACALGWSPTFVAPAKRGEGWLPYCNRVFGVRSGDRAWHWCFGGGWSTTDNTPQGAAKRILWMLRRGVPDDAVFQMVAPSCAPLCYTTMRAPRKRKARPEATHVAGATT